MLVSSVLIRVFSFVYGLGVYHPRDVLLVKAGSLSGIGVSGI